MCILLIYNMYTGEGTLVYAYLFDRLIEISNFNINFRFLKNHLSRSLATVHLALIKQTTCTIISNICDKQILVSLFYIYNYNFINMFISFTSFSLLKSNEMFLKIKLIMHLLFIPNRVVVCYACDAPTQTAKVNSLYYF